MKKLSFEIKEMNTEYIDNRLCQQIVGCVHLVYRWSNVLNRG